MKMYLCKVLYRQVHSGVVDSLINYDPFHRFEICFVKEKPLIDGILSQKKEKLMRKELDYIIQSVLKDINDGTLELRGTNNEDDLCKLIINKLKQTIKKYSLEEKTYFQLTKDYDDIGTYYFNWKP